MAEHPQSVRDRHGYPNSDVLGETQTVLLQHVELEVFHEDKLTLEGVSLTQALSAEGNS